MATRLRTLAAAVLIAALAAPVAAGSPNAPWSSQFTPDVRATGAGGTIHPVAGGPTVDADRSFSELLDYLDSALFLSAFARRARSTSP